jgi:hypothetical protein
MIGGEWECRYIRALHVPSNTRFIAQTGQLLEWSPPFPPLLLPLLPLLSSYTNHSFQDNAQ